MKKVLLAIDGMTPDRKAFSYAVALCQRIRAELSIFQIIRPRFYREYGKKIRKKGLLARKFVEGSMVAATFAEAGEHEIANEIMAQARNNIEQLLPESERAAISCHMTIRSGCLGEEIVRYVNEHRDVVLTVYDTAPAEKLEGGVVAKQGDNPSKIKEHLSIPLVVVRSEG